jgi:hypothetical protein
VERTQSGDPAFDAVAGHDRSDAGRGAGEDQVAGRELVIG